VDNPKGVGSAEKRAAPTSNAPKQGVLELGYQSVSGT